MGKGSFSNLNWADLVLAAFRIIIILIVIIGTTNTLLSGKYTAAQWVSLTVSGIAQGSIYALIALGYTLVYGILLMINFAHGEIYNKLHFFTVSSAWLDWPAQPQLSKQPH